jgi:PAS domain S-box-containing protein
MIAGALALRNNAARIGAVSAESCDASHMETILEQAATRAAVALEHHALLDIERPDGFSDAAYARLLRRFLAECIETVRKALDEASCANVAVALRALMRPLIPMPEVAHKDRAFYHALMAGASDLTDTEPAEFAGLLSDLALTFRDVIYVHDMNGMILYVNPPGLALTNYAVDDVLAGLSIYDFVVPELLDMIEARLESPAAVSRAPYTSEIYTRDCLRIPVEITTRCIVKNRRIAGIIGLARDIRLAKRLETELRRSNTALDSLIAHAPIGMIQVDEAGIIVDLNSLAAGALGRTGPSDASDSPFYMLHDGKNTDLKALFKKACEDMRPCAASSIKLAYRSSADVTVIPTVLNDELIGAHILFTRIFDH